MSTYGSSSHKMLATMVVVVAVAGALAAGLGACQKEQTGAAAPPVEQSMKTPSPPEKNAGDTTGNPQQAGPGGDAGQKSQ